MLNVCSLSTTFALKHVRLVGVVSELTAKHTLMPYINTEHMQNIYVILEFDPQYLRYIESLTSCTSNVYALCGSSGAMLLVEYNLVLFYLHVKRIRFMRKLRCNAIGRIQFSSFQLAIRQ